MVRSFMLGMFVAASLAVTAPPAYAGGCGHAMPEGGLIADARGDTITYTRACSSPTILRVTPGTEVTWVNEDGFAHTVTAARPGWWNSADLAAGKRFSFTFRDPGIHPFYCMLHPAMGGAVVVGDGEFDDAAATVKTTTGASDADGAEPVASTGRDRSTGPLATGIGFAGIAVGFLAGRRRARQAG